MKSKVSVVFVLFVVALLLAACGPWPVTPEQRRLLEENKDTARYVNPKINNDSSVFFGENRWQNGIVLSDGSGLPFSESPFQAYDGQFEVFFDDGVIRFQVNADRNFYQKLPEHRYNNVAVMGFLGARPTSMMKVVRWKFEMRVSDVFGTTGFVIQPRDTFAFLEDGTLNTNVKMTLYGFSYNGTANIPHGLHCHTVYDWVPTKTVRVKDVDPAEWNEYMIQFTHLSPGVVSAEGYVNGEKVCEDTLFDFGPTEAQIWLDNYGFWIKDDRGNYFINYGDAGRSQATEYRNITIEYSQGLGK